MSVAHRVRVGSKFVNLKMFLLYQGEGKNSAKFSVLSCWLKSDIQSAVKDLERLFDKAKKEGIPENKLKFEHKVIPRATAADSLTHDVDAKEFMQKVAVEFLRRREERRLLQASKTRVVRSKVVKVNEIPDARMIQRASQPLALNPAPSVEPSPEGSKRESRGRYKSVVNRNNTYLGHRINLGLSHRDAIKRIMKSFRKTHPNTNTQVKYERKLRYGINEHLGGGEGMEYEKKAEEFKANFGRN